MGEGDRAAVEGADGLNGHQTCRNLSAFSREMSMRKIVPNLWYTDKAEEAAAFYASLLPESRVDAITTMPADSPSGSAGSVKIVEFTLLGRPFMAFGAGEFDSFNHAISLMVECDTQAEIDLLWLALSDGGAVEQCGWLKDRYGLSWQIVPTVLGEFMKDRDRVRAKRVATAMLKMIKLDIEGLKRAYAGEAG
jgi:predicted 3-demethylubiquinone-9 3-methyltransferase (glyoxalase superfamily)